MSKALDKRQQEMLDEEIHDKIQRASVEASAETINDLLNICHKLNERIRSLQNDVDRLWRVLDERTEDKI